jgi:hypothetical protein
MLDIRRATTLTLAKMRKLEVVGSQVVRSPAVTLLAERSLPCIGVDRVFLTPLRRLVAEHAQLAGSRVFSGVDGFMFVLVSCNHNFKEG